MSEQSFIFRSIRLFVVLCLLILACARDEEEIVVVARVNNSILTDRSIPETQLPYSNSEMELNMRKEYVRRWVERELLYQYAVRSGFSEDEEMKRELNRIKQEIMIQKLLQRDLDDEMHITQGELEEYYKANLLNYLCEETEYLITHLSAKRITAANRVRQKFQDNIELTSYAGDGVELTDEYFQLNHYMVESSLPEAFAGDIKKLDPMAISRRIKYNNAYHYLQVVDIKRVGEPLPLQDVEEKVRMDLIAVKKRRLYANLIQRLRIEADVFIDLVPLEIPGEIVPVPDTLISDE